MANALGQVPGWKGASTEHNLQFGHLLLRETTSVPISHPAKWGDCLVNGDGHFRGSDGQHETTSLCVTGLGSNARSVPHQLVTEALILAASAVKLAEEGRPPSPGCSEGENSVHNALELGPRPWQMLLHGRSCSRGACAFLPLQVPEEI